MKQLYIPRVDTHSSDLADIALQLSSLPSTAIDTVNWPSLFPSKPDVGLRLAHNGDQLLLQYHVRESELLAVTTEDNGPVWTDSCVEMFLSFDGNSYYNAEFNCVGKALLGYRAQGQRAEHASAQVLQSIARLPSLGTQNRELQQGDFEWTLTLVIPKTTFWMHGIESFSGLKVKGNFFKCGDNLTIPHYLAWTKIDTPKPSFHQPQFFGELLFE